VIGPFYCQWGDDFIKALYENSLALEHAVCDIGSIDHLILGFKIQLNFVCGFLFEFKRNSPKFYLTLTIVFFSPCKSCPYIFCIWQNQALYKFILSILALSHFSSCLNPREII